MPALLKRLRSLGRSNRVAKRPPPIQSVEAELAWHEERYAHASAEDASPENHTNIELDSKIYPDLSALFASVEEALKSHERVAEAQKEDEFDGSTESENNCGEQRRNEKSVETSTTNESAQYASVGSGFGAGWSTFGQDDSPCLMATRRMHTANKNRVITSNFRRSSADAVLSWSPKPIESSESLRPSNCSCSSPALYTSPDIQQSTLTSVYYSPSPGTFGQASPAHLTPVDFPTLPPPVFHSTPKTTTTSRSRSLPRRSPRKAGRSRFASVGVPRLPSRVGRMKRAKSDLPRSSKRHASVSGFEVPERLQTAFTRTTTSVRGASRRKSAEWNARAASAGVVADPAQATEFGWPAEVSREILRLSLGEHAMMHGHEQGAPWMAAETRLQPDKAESHDFKRGYPHVSHDYKKPNGKIIRSNISENRFSSAPLYTTTLPPSSLTSSAPGRSDRPQTTVTQSASYPLAPSLAARKSSSQSSGDNILDTESMGAAGAPQHRRSESENKIEWNSAELQEFISREESNGNLELDGDVSRPINTPMKKSDSDSTYQTAGSSSYLHAPSLSVIAPTPRSSPGGSKHSSRVLPEAADGLQVPTPPPQTAKSKGKRKAEDPEDGSPPETRAQQVKKADLANAGPRRNSSASHAPSSFQSFQSQKSRKRVRLSSPMATPDYSRPASAGHLNSVSSRGSSRSPAHSSQLLDGKAVPPRPTSRASRISRVFSTTPSTTSSVAFPRRSLSQASIPLSAIITPRAPSVDRLSSFHMRDPRKPPPPREVGWTLRFSSYDDKWSPFGAWAFWFGFLFPMLWWVASFWKIPETRMVGTDTEKAVLVDDPFYEREARSWRLRCRIASVVFFVSYAPVIILLAIFLPRS